MVEFVYDLTFYRSLLESKFWRFLELLFDFSAYQYLGIRGSRSLFRLKVDCPLFLESNVMFLSHGQRGNVLFSFIVLPNSVVETRTFCCLHTFYVILELNCFLYYGCYVISLMKRLKQKEPFFSLWSQGCLFRSVRNRINFRIPVILFIERNPPYAAPVFLQSSCCTRHNIEEAVQHPYFRNLLKANVYSFKV